MYGLEFKNNNDYRVIDEDNEVMVVSEKGSTTGNRTAIFGSVTGDSVNADYAGEWIRVTHNGSASGRTKFWFTNIVLSGSYSEKPILALRGQNGTGATLPRAYVLKHLTSDFTAIRVVSRQPVPIDWILITTPSQAQSSSLDISSATYGLIVKDDSPVQKTLFDSRWPSLFSIRDNVVFPTLSTSNYIDNGVPSQTVNIPESPGAFFAIDTIYGHHSVVEQIEQEQEFGASLLLFGGGEYYPTVRQTSDTTVSCTMVNAEEGVSSSSTGGDVVIDGFFQNTGGEFLVVRYINF